MNDYAATRERYIEQARQRVQPTIDYWGTLTAALPEPLRAIAEAHAPHWYEDTSTVLKCLGCDQGCSCDAAEWPCTTAEIVMGDKEQS